MGRRDALAGSGLGPQDSFVLGLEFRGLGFRVFCVFLQGVRVFTRMHWQPMRVYICPKGETHRELPFQFPFLSAQLPQAVLPRTALKRSNVS